MSLPIILAWRLDSVLFVASALATVAASRWIIRRRHKTNRHHPLTFLLMAGIVGTGIWWAETSDRGEREQIRRLVSGLAPTLAHELSALGHASITLDTPADDPGYLALIERQKAWLRLNPQVADIYTYRRLPDGRIVFIVDSETDYNRDGAYSAENEKRTPIGYDYKTADEKTARALAGEPVFDTEIVSDEWGVFISYDQPMYDSSGRVEAVLGIDFPAEEWVRSILLERAQPLLTSFVLLLVVVGSSTLVALMRAEIEERKKIESILRDARIEADRANRSKSEFLAAMSHEIRTPMNSLIGFSNLLMDTPLNPEQHDYVLTLRSSANNLLALLNDILDLSKIEAGRTQIEHIPFRVGDTISAVTSLFAAPAAEKHLVLTVDDDNDDLKLVGDPHRLRQILTNLLSNAVKFTETGSLAVRVRWQPTGGNNGVLRCDVTDTGIGIPADRIPWLFKKFSQADASTMRRYGGSGLGLALSRELAQLMGGTLSVKSELHRGTVFTLQLPSTLHDGPLTTPAAPLIGVTVAAPAPVKKTSSGHVLIAEDNATNRKLATIMIEKLGYTVDTAVNGNEAIKKIFATPYDLVLMDCEMPELDGFETTQAIRAWEKTRPGTPHMPVIALTANAMPGVEQRCLDAGMDLYLTKPIVAARMREMLTKFGAPVMEAGFSP